MCFIVIVVVYVVVVTIVGATVTQSLVYIGGYQLITWPFIVRTCFYSFKYLFTRISFLLFVRAISVCVFGTFKQIVLFIYEYTVYHKNKCILCTHVYA